MVWTTIPDSDIDPDSPITTGLMTAYRDNFAAMAAGDTGAPDIEPLAFAKTITASNAYLWTCASGETRATTTPTKKVSVVIPVTGTYRIGHYSRMTSTGTPRTRIYKNGVAHGATRNGQSSGSANEVRWSDLSTYYEDLAFTAGDTLELWFWQSSGSGLKVFGFAVWTNESNLPPPRDHFVQTSSGTWSDAMNTAACNFWAV